MLFCGCRHKCWDGRLKFDLKRYEGRSFFFPILLTPMFGFLLASFTAAGVEEGCPHHYSGRSRKSKEKETQRQSVEPESDCAASLNYSFTLRQNLNGLTPITDLCNHPHSFHHSLSLTHTLADTRTPKEPRHTHTHTHPLCFPLRTISCGICES